MKSYLNLGCGQRFDHTWTNVDYFSDNPHVISHNLRKGIPFSEGTFDVVYHSHLLEHLSRSDVLPFLSECHRVLKPGGITRVAVPDLERICRAYLDALDDMVEGKGGRPHDYDWIMLEFYDQTVREESGGEMATYLSQENITNRDFVISRLGIEARRIIEAAEQRRSGRAAQPAREMSVRQKVVRFFYQFLRDSALRRELLIRHVLGSEYELLQLGRFRRSGELHLWMYDRYSLAEALQVAGFNNPQLHGPTESQIDRWADYHLDTESDGTIYKPDSLYMEAFKR